MDQQIKAAWITALTDGSYQQGEGVLQDVTNGQFCCLGVLCDLAVKAGIIPRPLIEEQHFVAPNGSPAVNGLPIRKIARYGFPGDTSVEDLPPAVAEWAQIPFANTNPSVTTEHWDDEDGAYYTQEDTLAELNDSGTPFIAIADLIKEHL